MRPFISVYQKPLFLTSFHLTRARFWLVVGLYSFVLLIQSPELRAGGKGHGGPGIPSGNSIQPKGHTRTLPTHQALHQQTHINTLVVEFTECDGLPIDLGCNPAEITEEQVIADAGMITSNCNIISVTATPDGSPFNGEPLKFYGMTSFGGANFGGVIFEWNPAGNVYTKKIDLNMADGFLPFGDLTYRDEMFYGLTSLGGDLFSGVIFSWDPEGNVYTKKIDLNSIDGGVPGSNNLTFYNGKYYAMTNAGGLDNVGAILEWDPDANICIKRMDFDFPSGYYPNGSMTMHNDKFYGMTSSGGAFGAGVIFEWDPATNVYTVQQEFDGNNGSFPYGDLTFYNGKFYGLTVVGGLNNEGVIFEWDPVDNILINKYDLGGDDGSFPYGSLVLYNSRLYGMTNSGGIDFSGVIFEWDPADDSFEKKIDLTWPEGAFPYGSLTVYRDKLYGMTNAGGFDGVGVIFEWDPATNVYTRKKEFNEAEGTYPYGRLKLNTTGEPSCQWSQSWTVTAIDDCNNESTCTVTYVWTEDADNPEFTSCPVAIIDLGNNPPAITEAQAIDDAGSVTDNCEIASIEAIGGSIQANGCIHTQSWTVVAEDQCGHQAVCEVMYTWTAIVNELEFTACPVSGIELGCNPDPVSEAQAISAAGTVTGGCGEAMLSATAAPINQDGCISSQTWEVVATDVLGNTAVCVVEFSWTTDTKPADFSACDLNILDATHACDGTSANEAAADAWNTANLIYLEGCVVDPCGDVTITSDYDFNALTDDCGETGVLTVTYTVTDACQNSATAQGIFTIYDTDVPLFSSLPSDITVECDGSGNATQFGQWLDSHGGAEATDACGAVTWSYTPFPAEISDECGATGSVTVTFRATDDCGNYNEAAATFTIEDSTDPSIEVAASDVTVECDGSGNAAELAAWLSSNGGAEATDDCSSVTWTNNFTSLNDDCGATGSVIVTYTASDNCGNTNETTATFTIWDTTAPSIDVEASNSTVECDGAGNVAALAAWLSSNGGAEAGDACSEVVWAHDFSGWSDDCGATGSATVTFTATDDCGNASETTATFTIEDTTPPGIDVGAFDVTVECDGAGNTAELTAWLSSNGGAFASDACSEVIWSNNFSGLSDDCGTTGNATVTFTTTDDCGNASQTTATFTIEDTTTPSMDVVASDITVECDGSGNAAELAAWLSSKGGAEASDACSDVVWTHDFSGLSDDCGATGSATVIFRATDDCGFYSETSATFTIEDTTTPDIGVLPQDLTVECDGSGNATQLSDWLSSHAGASASDVCSSVEWTHDFTTLSDDCGATGSTTVQFTATDECGNSATAIASFTISDQTAPSGTPPSGTTGIDACTPIQAAAEAAFDALLAASGYFDICGESVTAQLTHTLVSGGDCGWSVTYTFKVIDECGNELPGQTYIDSGSDQSFGPTVSTLSILPSTQQYSDKMDFKVIITGGAVGCGCHAATEVTFYVGSQEMGSAPLVVSGTDLIALLPNIPLLEGVAGQMSPGVKTVSAIISGINPNYTVAQPADKILTITIEDASVDYDGDEYFSTGSPASCTGTITVSAYVEDDNDVSRGDIRNADLTFTRDAFGGAVLGSANVPVSLIAPEIIYEGNATTSFGYTLNSANCAIGGETFEVYMEAGRYYTGSTTIPPGSTLITIAVPGQDFITGGGHMNLSASSGSYAGASDTPMNFGFQMKWFQSGKNLDGNILVHFRRFVSGVWRTYRISSDGKIKSVTVNLSDPAFRKAIMNTKAILTDITNPGSPVLVAGNLNLDIDAWESTVVSDGSLDRIAVTLTGNGNQGMYFSSHWNGSTTVAQLLEEGKIRVRSDDEPQTYAIAPGDTDPRTEQNPPTYQPDGDTDRRDFHIRHQPNPFREEANIQFDLAASEQISLKVFNSMGQVVAILHEGILESGPHAFVFKAQSFPEGIYFYHFIAGHEVRMGRMALER